MSTAAQLVKEINKMMGGEVVKLGSDSAFEVTYIPTGVLPIDVLLSGGLARGRFTVFYGGFSTLKSYIGLNAIRQVQQAGGTTALIDTEHAFDAKWARQVGVDTKALILQRPATGELAIDIAEVLVSSGVDLIVFDSVAAALPQDERKKRLHDESSQPGRLAALMSKACRKLTAANDNTAVLWINQMREQIGVTFGPTEKVTGGRALPYYASCMVNIRPAGKVTRSVKTHNGEKWVDGKEEVAKSFRAVVDKSKLDRPHREVHFDFRLEDPAGVDEAKFLFAQGLEHGYVEQRGSSLSYHEWSIKGREKFLAELRQEGDLWESLTTEVRAHHGLPPLPGRSARPKKAGSLSRRASSGAKAQGGTPTRARAASSGTAALKRTSTKSKR